MGKAVEENINSVSRISSGTSITGEMYSSSDVRIDGRFDGRIFSRGRIVIGETAEVTGDIICSNVDMWGKVKGNLYVKDTLSLKSGSSVDGSLNIRRFIVEIGASFNGTCKMITAEEFDKIAEQDVRKLSPEPAAQQSKDQKKK